jgi:mannose-6-phosphate isomerase-like protein (cupin superfamily)
MTDSSKNSEKENSVEETEVEKEKFTEITYVPGTERKKEDSMMTKTWQHPMYVGKGWGHEMWIVNKEEYCGKLLFFKKGKKCSWHYHILKDEVFYLQSGSLLVRHSDEDDITGAREFVMNPGQCFHIYRGLRHQMEALEDSELFEFSTQHFDSDSHRIIKGD